jgi:hypothetical protein
MKYTCKIYIFLLIIYSYIREVKLDLPVHCLSSKIEGNWIFYLGDNIHDTDLKCGHKRPDQNLDHYNLDVDKIFKHKHEVIIKLERPDKVFSIKDNRQIGKWTMIYDEGFEFTIYDQVFFAFNRYKKIGRFSASNTDTEDTKGYMNICNKTFLGWFHNKFTNAKWGCFWGEKIENNKLKSLDVEIINYRNIFDLNKIPELSEDRKKKERKFDEDKNTDNNDEYEYSTINANRNLNDLSNLKNEFIKTSKLKKNNPINKNTSSQSESSKNKNKNFNEINKAKSNENNDINNGSDSDNNEQKNNNMNNFSYVDFLKSLRNESSKAKYNNIPHLDIYFLNNDSDNDSDEKNGNFLEVNASTKLFQPDIDYVNKVNDPKNNYLWTAKVHDDFTGKSYSQMRNLLGNVNFFKSSFFDGEADNTNSNAENSSHNNSLLENEHINKIHLTEKEKLLSFSKNEIKNFLEYASFLEFDINVETSSFLNTESNSQFLAKAGEYSKSKITDKNKESKSQFEIELDSEEFELSNKNSKTNNSKNKNSKKNKNNLKKTSQDSDNQNFNDNENEIDIELSEDLNMQKDVNKQNGKYGKLSLEFDWRNVDGTSYDSPVRKQGECGSCYAIAATSVLESRIRIKSNNRLKPLLSPSSILSCSRYNQGCFGGYPYLVGKFGKEFGFVEESCQPYTETDDKCFDFCFHEKKWKVKSYG